jgi:ABC-type dipeptide/oligopeptide/nickel transport system permease subunit
MHLISTPLSPFSERASEKRRVDINIGLGYSAEVLNYQAFDGWFGTDKTGSDTLSHLAALKRAPKPCPFRMK